MLSLMLVVMILVSPVPVMPPWHVGLLRDPIASGRNMSKGFGAEGKEVGRRTWATFPRCVSFE